MSGRAFKIFKPVPAMPGQAGPGRAGPDLAAQARPRSPSIGPAGRQLFNKTAACRGARPKKAPPNGLTGRRLAHEAARQMMQARRAPAN